MTMASSSHTEPVIKYFFYGQNVSTHTRTLPHTHTASHLHARAHTHTHTHTQVSTFDLFLMEVNVAMNPPSLKFNLKCDKLSQAPDFIKHFLQTLVANDWLSRS